MLPNKPDGVHPVTITHPYCMSGVPSSNLDDRCRICICEDAYDDVSADDVSAETSTGVAIEKERHFDLDGLITLGSRNHVIGVSYTTGSSIAEYFDPHMASTLSHSNAKVQLVTWDELDGSVSV